jgi:hypothetical protein
MTSHGNPRVRPTVIAQVSLEDIFHITDDARVGRIVLTYVTLSSLRNVRQQRALIERTTR